MVFYFGKVILISGVFLLYYLLLLKDTLSHQFNRFFLLTAMLLSITIPFIKTDYFVVQVNTDVLSLVTQLDRTVKQTNDSIKNPVFVYITMGLVAMFFLSRFIIGIFKIVQLKKRFTAELFEGIRLYRTNLLNAPFSYFRNLFWKDSIAIDSTVGKQIFHHEMVHIRQKHTYDKIFTELIKCIFWFNPFFYLIKKEIHLIHEYLADRESVDESDTAAFTKMLLVNHFSVHNFPAVSPLFSSNIKKRINMLKTTKTKYTYLRKVLTVPVVLSSFFLCMLHSKESVIRSFDALAIPLEQITMEIAAVQQKEKVKEVYTAKDLKSHNTNKQVEKVTTVLKDPVYNTTEHSTKPPVIAANAQKSTLTYDDEFNDTENIKLDHTILSTEKLQRIRQDALKTQRDAEATRIEAAAVRKQAEIIRKQAASIQKEAEQVKANLQQQI